MALNEFVGVTQPFMRLEDLLLPPPLPSMLALLMVLGTLHLSLHGARWLRVSAASPVDFAAAFVLTTGLLAALIPSPGLGWGRIRISNAPWKMGTRGTGHLGAQLLEVRGGEARPTRAFQQGVAGRALRARALHRG
jgi:hypothetical protein